MRICVFWEYFQHYHSARVRVLIESAIHFEHELFPISICGEASGVHRSAIGSDISERITTLYDRAVDDPLNHSLTSEKLLSFIKANRIDVVFIIGWNSKVSRSIVAKAKRLGVRVVLMLEGQKKDCPRYFFKEAYKRYYFLSKVDAIFCGGTSHADYARSLGFDPKKIFDGYDAVDNNYWSQLANKARSREEKNSRLMDLGTDEGYFVASGRFVEKKNFIGLITAYADYLKMTKSEKKSLVLIGDGPLRKEIEEAIEKYDLNFKVKLPGYLEPDEVAEYFAFASAFIMPSSHYEQWGLVVNEAMACSLPVIVSDICGCAPDLVRDGQNGFVYPANNLSRLTQLMCLVGEDKCNIDEMGMLSSDLIQGHGLEHFAENFYKAAEVALSS